MSIYELQLASVLKILLNNYKLVGREEPVVVIVEFVVLL